MYRDTSSTWKVLGVLLVIIVVLRLVGSCIGSISFNNGICPKCGGSFKYLDAVGYRYTTTYLYRCNKCGNIIESMDLYNDKEFPFNDVEEYYELP